jgi:beta-phosphoglucomutase-like phosphatase (HAD superfamily)
VRLLVLLDVDGTLFLTHDPLAGRALHETLQERFGVRLPDDAIEQVDHEGQTSLRIGRLLLEAAGVGGEPIDDGLAEWCTRFAERYIELLAHADTSGWCAAPRAEQALERLAAASHRPVLLTATRRQWRGLEWSGSDSRASSRPARGVRLRCRVARRADRPRPRPRRRLAPRGDRRDRRHRP